MQTIITKYLPATNSRGSRIKATTTGGTSVTVPYDHALDVQAAHDKAFRKLAEKMGWQDHEWHAGSLTTGFCYVSVDRGSFNTRVIV